MPEEENEVISGSAGAEGGKVETELVRIAKSLESLPLDMLAFSQPDFVPRLDWLALLWLKMDDAVPLFPWLTEELSVEDEPLAAPLPP